MLRSPRDQKARERFQELVVRVVPPHGSILDFGAGTGIDAMRYAAEGFSVQVHEPSEANLAYLSEHCRRQIAKGSIVITDLSDTRNVDLIAANFAVLNLLGDHSALFAKFAGLLAPRGFVLASLLNPYFLGDARYAWWRSNLLTLVTNGTYAIEGEFGRIYRFAPSVVSRAAGPDFTVLRSIPGWPWTGTSRYVFMLFQKR